MNKTHEEHLEPLFLYALDALTSSEMATVECQISSCPDCQEGRLFAWPWNIAHPAWVARLGRCRARWVTHPHQYGHESPHCPRAIDAMPSGVAAQIPAEDRHEETSPFASYDACQRRGEILRPYLRRRPDPKR